MPISDQTTVLSNLSLTGNFAALPTGQVSGVSSSRVTAGTVYVQGGASFSGVTADFRTNAVKQSWVTLADVSTLTTGFLGLVFQASGISLIYSSGKSVYVVGQSAQSAAGA